MELAQAGESATPPLPAPRALRRFLHFTRLPDRALAAARRAVEEDEAFRTRLAAVTSEDTLGRPSWLFVSRPEAWEQELAAVASAREVAQAEAAEEREQANAVHRLAHVEALLARATADAEQRLSELAELREQLGEERRARQRADSDLGRLRRRTADLEAELDAERGARRREAELGEQLAAARADADAARDELAEHRRAHEVDPRAAAGEGPTADVAAVSSPGTDVDVERLGQAVAAATRAVADLAEALGAAAAQLAPHLPVASGERAPDERATQAKARTAETVGAPGRRPRPLPPAVHDDSVEAAEHLLRLPGAVVLVDGYNLTKLAHPDRSLPDQRAWSVAAADRLAARTGAEVQLVFDGSAAGSAPAERPRRSGVQVRFTPEGTEADDVLLDLVTAIPPGRPVVVASSDRRVQDGARRRGANVVGSGQLLDLLRR